jgi:hypothetical protein
MNKRSELANILRQLADYIDRRSDDELAPLFNQAAGLMQAARPQKKYKANSKTKVSAQEVAEIARQLRMLPSRELGEALLQDKITNRNALETLARFLQLPVQRDDTVDRLRAKIVENTIGSRLRSDAIQGKDR